MPNFLISRLSALGDTVCSLPAAVALKRAFPDSHISWVVDPRFAGIVECCKAVDEVIPVKISAQTIPTYSVDFEAALDLQGLLKSGLCLMRAKAKRKVGYHWRREAAWLFSERILPDPTSFHIVDQYVDVARAVGGVMDRAEFQLEAKENDIHIVRALLKDNQLNRPFVVINAGAGWATKRWLPEAFATVIEALDSNGLDSVLIGSKGQSDVDAATQVIDRGKSSPLNLVGKTSVRELIALIALSEAHLGGDTGSSHVAAALSKPAVGLYSITKPLRSCPYGQIDRCLYDPESLANIKPDEVLRVLLEAIS